MQHAAGICINANLNADVLQCMSGTCIIKETLTSLKYSADESGAPIRDNGPLTRTVSWSFFGLALLAIALRFVARSSWSGGPGHGWDDWTMLVVLAFLIGMEVCVELIVQIGLGRDIWMLVPGWHDVTSINKLFWISEMCYTVVVNFMKISILLFYLRIFPSTVTKWFRIVCFVIIGACAANTVALVVSIAFEYIHKMERRSRGEYINVRTQVLFLATINITLDLVVCVLPIPKIWMLKMSTSKRIGACFIFLMGLFVTVVSIIRLPKLAQYIRSSNPTENFVPIVIWSQAEVNLGVVCSCMPSPARLIRQFWNATIGTLVTRVSEITSGRSPEKPIDGQIEVNGEAFIVPINSYTKTKETSVFSRKIDSTDWLELMGKYSSNSTMEDGTTHKYSTEW